MSLFTDIGRALDKWFMPEPLDLPGGAATTDPEEMIARGAEMILTLWETEAEKWRKRPYTSGDLDGVFFHADFPKALVRKGYASSSEQDRWALFIDGQRMPLTRAHRVRLQAGVDRDVAAKKVASVQSLAEAIVARGSPQ